ncbi:MAG: 1-acyl-sn-glycerol-3-phosphate acyltransferase [Propionibacteriaceae bacterium]|jgi:1-acyl-sn-glycerol-3-phosphate acyltransferase|nr:1-acyl-sn-glycerol-3-phosphate acyltransferase [Propionibacteriaceae bacterium]
MPGSSPVRQPSGFFARRLSRVNQEPAHVIYRIAIRIVHLIMSVLGSRDWRDQSKLPQTGGIIVVSDHISKFDPLPLADYLAYSGRWPRFLGKIELSRSIIGPLFKATESIPVDRGSLHAVDALAPAAEALKEGKAVTIYPEGTETYDPDLWPMTAKTGAARLALATGAPVIPVAQWGAHNVLAPHVSFNFNLRHDGKRHRFSVICGDPVDLSDLMGRPLDRAVLEIATTRIMDAITDLIAILREETPPTERYSRKARTRLPIDREVPAPPAAADDAAADSAPTAETGDEQTGPEETRR